MEGHETYFIWKCRATQRASLKSVRNEKMVICVEMVQHNEITLNSLPLT